ncbi:serine/threonine protein kinase [Streptomyces sp. NRRL F-5122]|uniref:serine/threonine-protein kinase n=1 Tax=Streptomyces sp. NRRL F-5122 TaxID=1609098 RepID=UPI000740DF3A|nr:serine/threonine-protein kinase [Streptomyces sp. NRRL F-5122]KUJ41931.1 serine/threonine protein kinase [Streptomyces sp. NRRL F-5122]
MNNATEVFLPLQADDPPMVAGYRLAARLGAGGMGRVYLSHTPGGRPVAIKVVRPELADDPDFRRRFRREIKAAQRVRGAYTAELIDADADGVPPWLATLYVPGPSLAQAVARRGPLPVPAVLWLMAGVAEALQAIHGAGIVHRDLKPSNVLLAADGPRVIDFGISQTSDVTSHTASGYAVGTPQFMAPEQASAGEVTAATDVFALGQTAAFAALGEPLYGDGPSVSVLYRIVHSKPDLSPLPAELRPLIARCLAADPAERATPAEVVDRCRRQLGPDADAGAGPAVWREVTGPEVTVPPPVPVPTSLYTPPLPAPGQQTAPDGQRVRPRRTTVITAAVMTAAVLLLTALGWAVMDGTAGLRHGNAAKSSTSGPTASAGSSGSARSSASSRGSLAAAGADDREGAAPGPSPSTPASPLPDPYPIQFLDEKGSLSLGQDPISRKDRKGDLRLACTRIDCSLESDTSRMNVLYGKTPGSLDECRTMVKGIKRHSLSMFAVAAGSQICVENRSGDVALVVIQQKSTAMPDSGSSFVTADVTVWRAP